MNVAHRSLRPQNASDRLPTRHPGRVARIEIVNDVAAAEAPWRALLARNAVATPYQNDTWIALWQQHVGALEGIRPFIVIGYDIKGEALFVLPLGRSRIGPITVARFFGGKHSNLNMGVWRRDFAETATAGEMEDIIERISGHSIDLLQLSNQPAEWNGVANPLTLLPHQPSTSDNFRLALAKPGANVVKEQISSTMRSRLRSKERKLAKLADYRYTRPQSVVEVDLYLDAFFMQKATRLQQQGIENVFALPGVAQFARAVCREGMDEGRPLVEIHVLEAEGEVLALFAGTQDGDRFTAMFNSYTLGENARWSPGLILLMHLVADCGDRGIKSFDIGLGDAQYKSFFCKEREPLIDNFIPLSTAGRVLSAAIRPAYAAKRWIKHSPVIWTTLKKLRQKVGAGE